MKREEAVTWLAGIFDEPPGNVTTTTTREEIYGWDSLGMLTLMAEIDEKFGIQLAEQDIAGLKSIGDVLDLLGRNGKLS